MWQNQSYNLLYAWDGRWEVYDGEDRLCAAPTKHPDARYAICPLLFDFNKETKKFSFPTKRLEARCSPELPSSSAGSPWLAALWPSLRPRLLPTGVCTAPAPGRQQRLGCRPASAHCAHARLLPPASRALQVCALPIAQPTMACPRPSLRPSLDLSSISRVLAPPRSIST